VNDTNAHTDSLTGFLSAIGRYPPLGNIRRPAV